MRSAKLPRLDGASLVELMQIERMTPDEIGSAIGKHDLSPWQADAEVQITPMWERSHSSVTVLLEPMPCEHEWERREVRDENGVLVTVEIWSGRVLQASWGGEFDRVLATHPAVVAMVEAQRQP